MGNEAYNDRFRNAAVKLMNKSLLCRDFDGDSEDYRFIKDNFDDFAEYFGRMGLKLEHHRPERTMKLFEEEHPTTKFRRESSSKAEIAVFIILREKYLQNMDNLEFTAVIRRRDILDAMPACFNGRNFSPTKYEEIMRKLRRHDLINWRPGTDLLNPESLITVYPSILFAQDDKAVNDFFEELKKSIERKEEEE